MRGIWLLLGANLDVIITEGLYNTSRGGTYEVRQPVAAEVSASLLCDVRIANSHFGARHEI